VCKAIGVITFDLQKRHSPLAYVLKEVM